MKYEANRDWDDFVAILSEEDIEYGNESVVSKKEWWKKDDECILMTKIATISS